ncbi:MAG TPA: Hsp20/alpha crystallin family protein [Chloroflexi bacterium]|nr:Hsp20/alpha crystallin family protein [Chloroflexota bacterium]
MMTFYYNFPRRRWAEMREAMNRMMEDALEEMQPQEREMTLAVDVLADDDGYTIRALVPGVRSEDLSIEALNNTVTIRGEFTAPEAGAAKYLVSELPVGRFVRVITLPTALEPGKTEATLKDGVLTLRIPKAEAHRPKTIEVKVG